MAIALRKIHVPDNTVQLICSFHEGKEARICLNWMVLEKINVN